MAEVTAQLSDREQEVLRLVATGATNQQIANTLNISINTVKVHLRNIFEKIGVTSRTEATMYAVSLGLVSVPAVGPAPTIDDPQLPPDGEVASNEAQSPVLVESLLPSVAESYAAVGEVVPAAPISVLAGATTAVVQPVARLRRLYTLALVLAALVVGLAIVLGFVLINRRSANVGGLAAQNEDQRWSSRAPLPTPRDHFALAFVDNQLYVIGGDTGTGASSAVERYDIASNVWATLSNKDAPVTQAEAVTIDGRIYVPGGEDVQGKILTTFEVYDPRTQHWQSLPALPEPRSRYALAKYEGRLYLFGGWDGSHVRSDVLIFDPIGGQWSKGTPLPTPRRNAGAAAVGDRIYVMGGDDASGPLRVNERYDPTGANGGQWDRVVPLPVAITSPAVVALVDAVFAFDSQRHSAAKYSAQTDTWDILPLRADVPVSDRAAGLSTTILSFGSAVGGKPNALSSYQAIYSLFLPDAKSSQ